MVKIPIRSDVPCQVIVNAVQAHAPLMSHHPLITKFKKRLLSDADMASIHEDPFSNEDENLASFTVHEVFLPYPSSMR